MEEDATKENEESDTSALGGLPYDLAAAVLAHVHPLALFRCSLLNRSLRAICLDICLQLTKLDLSLHIESVVGIYARDEQGLDTFTECAAVREACQLLSREPLHQKDLFLILKRIPTLTMLSMRGRLLQVDRTVLEKLHNCASCQLEEGACDDTKHHYLSCFWHPRLSAFSQLTHLDLSFAAVASPACWGGFFPPSLTSLDALGFFTRRLDVFLEGLARAPVLRHLNIQGSGVFPTAQHVNVYDSLRSLAGLHPPAAAGEGGMLGGDCFSPLGQGCRQLRTLRLGNIRSLRLMGCKALLRTAALNVFLCALDVRHVVAAEEGDTLLKGLSIATPCLRALAVGGLSISDVALDALAQGCCQLSRLHLSKCAGYSPEAVGRLLCRTPISAILIAGRGGEGASTVPSAMEEAHAGGMGQDIGGEGGTMTQRWSRALHHLSNAPIPLAEAALADGVGQATGPSQTAAPAVRELGGISQMSLVNVPVGEDCLASLCHAVGSSLQRLDWAPCHFEDDADGRESSRGGGRGRQEGGVGGGVLNTALANTCSRFSEWGVLEVVSACPHLTCLHLDLDLPDCHDESGGIGVSMGLSGDRVAEVVSRTHLAHLESLALGFLDCMRHLMRRALGWEAPFAVSKEACNLPKEACNLPKEACNLPKETCNLPKETHKGGDMLHLCGVLLQRHRTRLEILDVRNVTSPMAAALAARLLLRWQCWNAWLLEGGGGGGGGGGVLRGPGQDGFQKLCRLEMRRAAGPLVAVVGAAAANDLVDSCPYSSLLFDAHVDAHMQRDEPHICSARFASSGLNAIVIVGSKVSRTRGDREWMNGDICTASGMVMTLPCFMERPQEERCC